MKKLQQFLLCATVLGTLFCLPVMPVPSFASDAMSGVVDCTGYELTESEYLDLKAYGEREGAGGYKNPPPLTKAAAQRKLRVLNFNQQVLPRIKRWREQQNQQ